MQIFRDNGFQKFFFLFIFRVYKIELPAERFIEILNTQSRNSTAKYALRIDDVELAYYEEYYKKKYDWLKIKLGFISLETFMFKDGTFFAPMFIRLINRLIDTGVIKHLNEKFYMKKANFLPQEAGPSVLSVDDLAFGFNIWLGSCLVSFIVFMIELIFEFFSKKDFKALSKTVLNNLRKSKVEVKRKKQAKINENSRRDGKKVLKISKIKEMILMHK